jgi:hypothetical protein
MTKSLKIYQINWLEWKLKRRRPDNRNPNQFRRPFNPPQVLQRERRNEDQPIQAPIKNENLVDNLVEEEFEDIDEEMNMMEGDLSDMHVTQDEYEKSLSFNSYFNEDDNNNQTDTSSSQYRVFSDALQAELHKKYDLRPRTNVNTTKTNNQGQPDKIQNKDKGKEITVSKQKYDHQAAKKTDAEHKETEKISSSFNLENELNKIRIPIPLLEIAKNLVYRKQVLKMIDCSIATTQPDTLNLQDERPTVMFGPHIEERGETVAPFYISLTVHEHLLHNCMLDSGASHNLMPKIVMEKLGLQITRPYHDLYSFDARKVRCLGMIKDLVVHLAQIPVKSVLMDIVVVDVPVNYGMLLSRSWERKLGGSLQMDMTYATIPVFGGETRRLYRETKLAYIVSDPNHPNNYLVYSKDQDLGCFILSVNNEPEVCTKL